MIFHIAHATDYTSVNMTVIICDDLYIVSSRSTRRVLTITAIAGLSREWKGSRIKLAQNCSRQIDRRTGAAATDAGISGEKISLV